MGVLTPTTSVAVTDAASVAQTIAIFTNTASAERVVSGLASQSFAAFTNTSNASTKVSVTASLTLEPFTESSSGTVQVSGVIVNSSGPFASTSNASSTVAASAAQSFDAATTISLASNKVSITANQLVAPIVEAATSATVVTGLVVQTVGAFSASSSVSVISTGSAYLPASNHTDDEDFAGIGPFKNIAAVGDTFVSGVANQSFAVFVNNSYDSVLASASATSVIDPFTNTSDGDVRVSATVAQIISNVSSASTVRGVVSVSASNLITPFTTTTVISVISTGSAIQTIEGHTSTGSISAVAGIVSTTSVAPITLVATGVSIVSATTSSLVGPVSSVTAGSIIVSGSATQTFDNVTSISNNFSPMSGDAVQLIGPATSASITLNLVRSSVTQTFGAFTGTASSSAQVSSSNTTTLTPIISSAEGNARYIGSVDVTIEEFISTADGCVQRVDGLADSVVGDFISTAITRSINSATATQTFDDFTQASGGSQEIRVWGTSEINNASSNAFGFAQVSGVSAALIGPLSTNGAANAVVSGTPLGVIEPFSDIASVMVTVSYSGTVTIPSLISTTAGTATNVTYGQSTIGNFTSIDVAGPIVVARPATQAIGIFTNVASSKAIAGLTAATVLQITCAASGTITVSASVDQTLQDFDNETNYIPTGMPDMVLPDVISSGSAKTRIFGYGLSAVQPFSTDSIGYRIASGTANGSIGLPTGTISANVPVSGSITDLVAPLLSISTVKVAIVSTPIISDIVMPGDRAYGLLGSKKKITPPLYPYNIFDTPPIKRTRYEVLGMEAACFVIKMNNLPMQLRLSRLPSLNGFQDNTLRVWISRAPMSASVKNGALWYLNKRGLIVKVLPLNVQGDHFSVEVGQGDYFLNVQNLEGKATQIFLNPATTIMTA
jgi:hypothetical protein